MNDAFQGDPELSQPLATDEDAGRCRRLLIVDDAPQVRASLSRLLSRRGFQVSCAADGDEALRRLSDADFDIVLLDLAMPEVGGMQVLEFLRETCPETAVVVVSGTRSVPEATAALRQGAHDFLAKPYRVEDLLERIGRCCRRTQAERSHALMLEQLSASDRLHRFLVHSSPDLIFVLDGLGRLRFVNERLTSLLGSPAEQATGRSFLDLVAPAQRGRVSRALVELAEAPEGETRAIETQIQGALPMPVEIKLLSLGNAGTESVPGVQGELIGVARDLSERYEAQAARRRSDELLAHVISTSPAVVYARRPEGERPLTFVSDNVRDLLGFDPAELLSGRVRWQHLVHPDDLSGVRADLDGLPGALSSSLEYRIRHRDHGWRWVRDSVRLVCDAAGRPIELVGSWLDNTEAHLLSEQLKLQASLDDLTGLLNRRAFEQRLGLALASARREGFQHALCYLDLDQFKVINDTCGHIAGDSVLRQLARVLEGRIRQQDTLARLGGDEFGLLMERCSADGAIRVAEGLCKAVSDFRFVWGDKGFRVGVSVGLVMIDAEVTGMNAALSAADNACYAAKDAGRNRIHVYTEDDTELARRHGEMQWVSRITEALEQDRFGLSFQPIMPLSGDSEGHHYELLLRMRDKCGDMVMPGAFFPAAERYHLACRLDQWVLDRAITWLSENPAHLAELTLCSINLSGHSLGDPRLLGWLVERLEAHEGLTSKLCFEVTETAAISNMYSAVNFIRALRDMGCRFALDDFGSGLSSFAYLKTLPVDFIKIDGIFVEDIAVNPVAYAMVRSINEIGQVMGIKTVAEFVESDESLARVRDIGIDFAQGYGIGAPRPIEELLGPEARWPTIQ
ncbi:EAL domain-containing protein [Thiorhodococcus minor]|uniref:EAL domain-containing protein n=1 Tax=Thiorhodococcus minor TaxID=57489 RepID=A0A6M0JSX1_9GAMM|nr:EAL domain-containing protein [Thiorhodococcus minor]NEV60630.1 EAL domain-containing protein [Thiorhodococcus minor]